MPGRGNVIYRGRNPGQEEPSVEERFDTLAQALEFACRDMDRGHEPAGIWEGDTPVQDAASIREYCAERQDARSSGGP